MNHIAVKLVLTALCFLPAALFYPLQALPLPTLYSLSAVLLCEIKPIGKLKILMFVIWILCGIQVPEMVYFLPLFVYELFPEKFCLLNLYPAAVLFIRDTLPSIGVFLLVFAAIGAKYGVLRYEEMQQKYRQVRDNLAESTQTLEQRLSHFRAEQDSKIMLATLGERNRIAREIHDNIGHLLSSAILQIGAMRSVTKDQTTSQQLSAIHETLSQGMENVRKSVHDLRDDSVDLKLELTSLLEEFSFCEGHLVYDMDRLLPIRQRYGVLGIVKEALSNVMRHSDATKVTVTLQSHPGLNQLIIRDNGTKCSPDYEKTQGMGLESIRRRVSDMDGICDFSFQNGFRVFVSWKPSGGEDMI